MIFDKISNAKQYFGISPKLDAALTHLMQTDLTKLEDGKHPLMDGVFMEISAPTQKLRKDCRWEAHEAYIDIQVVLSGEDRMGVQPIDGMKVETPYTPDIVFYADNDKGSYVDVPEGMFVVFFPSDAHMPIIAKESPKTIRKVIYKVPVK